jgi:hypothetical protein
MYIVSSPGSTPIHPEGERTGAVAQEASRRATAAKRGIRLNGASVPGVFTVRLF